MGDKFNSLTLIYKYIKSKNFVDHVHLPLPDIRIKHIFNHDCLGLNSVDSKLNTISLSEGEFLKTDSDCDLTLHYSPLPLSIRLRSF